MVIEDCVRSYLLMVPICASKFDDSVLALANNESFLLNRKIKDFRFGFIQTCVIMNWFMVIIVIGRISVAVARNSLVASILKGTTSWIDNMATLLAAIIAVSKRSM